jgi:hypothetical protein
MLQLEYRFQCFGHIFTSASFCEEGDNHCYNNRSGNAEKITGEGKTEDLVI